MTDSTSAPVPEGLKRPSSFARADFVFSDTNREAIEALDAWPAWHGGCLALVGPEGVGKTHLALAWAAQVGAGVLQSADASPGLDLTPLQGRPVLFEDADRGAPDDVLFHLINMAGAAGGGLLLTARTAPSAWPAALPDLRSRLNALPVAELPPPDDAMLEGVLRQIFP